MRHLSLIIAAALLSVACTSKLDEIHEKVTIDGSVGKLVGDIDRPAYDGAKAPVAIILHGLTGHRAEPHLNAFRDAIYDSGVATVRFDYNGHGESEGQFSQMTLFNELEDSHMIYDYVAGLPWVDKDRIFVVGHSQGGLEAGLLAGELGSKKVRALLLLAPAACIHSMAEEHEFFGFRLGEGEFPDSLRFWKGMQLGKAYLQSAVDCDVYGIASRYDGPVTIIQGLKDTPWLIRDSERYTEYLPQAKYVSLEGLSHCYDEDMETPAKIGAEFILENI